MKNLIGLVIGGLVGVAGFLRAAEATLPAIPPSPKEAAAPATNDALAHQLVEKLWTAFAKPDTAALEKLMAPGFQSLHEDGPRTGPEELKLIAGLKLSGYTLAGHKVSRSGDVLVVSYNVTVGETIDATRLTKTTTPRMDVFQQIGTDWKWLAHVNVRPLVAATPAAAK